MVLLPQHIISFGFLILLFLVSMKLSYFTKNTEKEKNTRTHADGDSDQQKQKPYGYYNHPNKSFLDKVLGIIVYKLLNVGHVANYPCIINTNTTNGKNDKHLNNKNGKNDQRDSSSLSTFLHGLRETMTKNEELAYHQECKAWNNLIKKEIKTHYFLPLSKGIQLNEKSFLKICYPKVRVAN